MNPIIKSSLYLGVIASVAYFTGLDVRGGLGGGVFGLVASQAMPSLYKILHRRGAWVVGLVCFAVYIGAPIAGMLVGGP